MSTFPVIVPVTTGFSGTVASGPQYGVPYTLTGPDGTQAVFNDPANPNYVGFIKNITGLDSAEVRESADEIIGDDGGIHGEFLYGRRPLVIEGMIDNRPADFHFTDARTGVAATNEVINPSFETNTTGYVFDATQPRIQFSAAVERVSDNVRQGSWSGRRLIAEAGRGMYAYGPTVAVTPGERLAIRASGRISTNLPTGPTTLHLRVRQTNGGSYVGEPSILVVTNPVKDQWYDLEGEYVVPTGTDGIAVMLNAGGNSDYAASNYVRNPSVEVNTTDLNGFPSAQGTTTGGTVTVVRSTADAASGGGSACAEWTVTATTGGTGHYVALFHQNYNSLANLQTTAMRMAGGIGSSFVLAARMSIKAVTALPAGATLNLQVRFHDSAGAFISQSIVSGAGSVGTVSNPVTGQWYDLFGTITAPSNAEYAVVRADINGLADGATYTIRTDKAMITRSPSVTTFPAYGDGGTTDWLWGSTAHGSHSGIPIDLRMDRVQIVKTATGNPAYFDGSTQPSLAPPSQTAWEGTAHASRSFLHTVVRTPFDANRVRNLRMTQLQRATNAMRKDATLSWTPEGGTAQTIRLRRQQPLRISGAFNKEFQFAAVAPDPRIYGATNRELRTLPGVLTDIATNVGTMATPPTIVLTGPITNPTILNFTTGESVSLTYTLTAGNNIVIDFLNKTVRLNGTTSIYSAVNFASTKWWQLQPGDNNIRLSGSATTSATNALVQWRDAWV